MDLKLINKIKNNEIFGLDIGSSAVKIISLQKNNSGYKVKAVGISQLEAGKPIDFSDTPPKQRFVDGNLTRTIHDCFTMTKLRSRNKFKTKLAVCGVSGPEVAVRDYEFPPLPENEIESAVTLEAELVCPFASYTT